MVYATLCKVERQLQLGVVMWKIILVGGIGGLLPSLLEKSQAWNNGIIAIWLMTAPNIWIAILVASVPMIIYFVIGALMAAVYESQSAQKALLIGLGAPASILTYVSGAQQEPSQLKVADAVQFRIIGTAHAQSGAIPPDVQLKLDGSFPGQACVDCSVTFLGGDGRPIAIEPLVPSSPNALSVPDDTEVLLFKGPATNPAELDLRQLDTSRVAGEGPVTLDVGVNRSYWNDLARSFGARDVQPYNFSIEAGQR